MITAIGFTNVKSIETATVYEAACVYCGMKHMAEVRDGKVVSPIEQCRHFLGIMIDEKDGLIMSFRPQLP
jgi:hypothetical protein